MAAGRDGTRVLGVGFYPLVPNRGSSTAVTREKIPRFVHVTRGLRGKPPVRLCWAGCRS